jgi:hypothetical protein
MGVLAPNLHNEYISLIRDQLIFKSAATLRKLQRLLRKLIIPGIVTFIKDNSNTGGSNPIYWNHTNFIVIMHSNGEYSRYDHLRYNSSKVKVGQYVRVGEEIARVGMTGYTYLPHLHFHFQVFVATGINMWTDFDILEVQDFD